MDLVINGIDLKPYIPLVIVLIITIIFFSEDSKKSEAFSTRIRLLPTLWTAAGLLGTFLSLYIAFKNQSTIDLIDGVPGANGKVSDLLITLAQAFSTSIIGITISQVVSIYIVNRQKNAEASKEWHRDEPEKILFDLRETAISTDIYLRNAAEALQGISNQLSDKLATEFKTSLSGVTGKIMEDATNAVSGFTSHLSDTLEKGTSDLEKKYNQSIEVSKEKYEQLNKTISSSIQEQLASQITSVSKTLDSFKEGFLENQKAIAAQVDKFNDTNNSLLKKAESTHQTILDQLEANIVDIHKKISNIISELHKDSESLSEQIQNTVNKSDAQIRKTTKEFKSSVEQHEKSGHLHESVLSAVQNQHDILESLIQELKEDRRRFKTLSDEFDKIKDSIDEIREST